MTFFIELEKDNTKIQVEVPKTLNSQSSPKQIEQIWRHYNIWFQNVLQNHDNR
jgi:hypothetical protein